MYRCETKNLEKSNMRTFRFSLYCRSRSIQSQVISDIPAFALSLDCTIWLAELTVYLGFYLEFFSSTIFRDNLVISCFIQRYFNEGFSS